MGDAVPQPGPAAALRPAQRHPDSELRPGHDLAPHGHAIVELEPPGSPLRREQVRLCHAGSASAFGPATESTAQDWIKTYGIKYDVVIDPTDQLNNGTKPTFDPHSWIIDTKTMKIIHAIPGAPGSLLPYGLVSLLQ